MVNSPDGSQRTALVLSGGGARGAYEVGVVEGIIEALGLGAADRPPFAIFAGSSVGAINAAFLAAHTDRGDLAVHDLRDVWADLRPDRTLHPDPFGLFGWSLPMASALFTRGARRALKPRRANSLLHPEPFERLVERAIPWDRLRRNIARGKTHALIVAALKIATGQTGMFAELAPGADFRPSKDPRRLGVATTLGPEHVLASAAIPLIFPARRIGRSYYCDGGVRFNTPIAPAIRTGADRLVVITLQRRPEAIAADAPPPSMDPPGGVEERYPNALVLLGKLLNALLLDPISYDLHVLERMNRLLDALDQTQSAAAMRRLDEEMIRLRRAPYRKLDTLVFSPSGDIGRMAGKYLRTHLPRWRPGPLAAWAIGRAASDGASWESDLASYVLFDGAFAHELMEMGRADALADAARIRAFFAAG